MNKYIQAAQKFIKYEAPKDNQQEATKKESTAFCRTVKTVAVVGLGFIGGVLAVPSCIVLGVGSTLINVCMVVVGKTKDYMTGENQISLGKLILKNVATVFIGIPLMSCINSACALIDITFLFIAQLSNADKMSCIRYFNEEINRYFPTKQNLDDSLIAE